MLNRAGLLAICVSMAIGVTSAALAAERRAGEWIVKYQDHVRRGRLEMNELYRRAGVKSVQRLGGLMKGMELVVLEDPGLEREARMVFESHLAVEYVQPNYFLRVFPLQHSLDDSPPPVVRPDLKPEPSEVFPPLPDPYLTEDYAMKRIGATEVWKTDRGTKRFIVADIDSGIDYTHEDLASNLWRAKDSSGKETIGYDFIHNDDLPYDDLSHGTHTAGLIGAVGGNGVGISGVMQRVSIMALKFISSEGVGTTAGAIRAIDFAIAHGAKVLNNSWGQSADEDNPALREAIERAKAADVLFVAAAGNYSADNDGPSGTYPAAFDNDNLISVAASDKWDRLSFFSNFGEKSVHLAAPGDRIYSTLPHNKYREESGTSMACPLVSGAVALLWSKHPAWNYRKVKLVLLKNVDPLPTLQGKTITGGRLNVLKALRSTGD